MTLVLLIIALAIGLALAMTIAWAVVLRTGKSGWVDTVWSASIGIAGVIAALVPLAPGDPAPRAWLAAVLVAVWSARLAIHIGRRTLGGGDDPRYAQLREQWGDRYPTQLFLFLQIQAAVALILVVAVLAAAHNPAPLGWTDLFGIIIAAIAIGGEALSDAQLTAFRANPQNHGKVCDTGLWSLSRHPNYFFEWLYWLAYVPVGTALALAYPWGWFTALAPILMYWLLVHVSGVPPLEAHMLRSRGKAFADYQSRVRAFWPVSKR